MCEVAQRPKAQRPRSAARHLHGGRKGGCGSRCRDARSGSLQRMVGRLHWIRTDARKEFREGCPDSRWMPKRGCLESWDSVKRTRGRKAKSRSPVETLGAAAREASGRDRLAIDADEECCGTRWRLPTGNSGNVGCGFDAK